jgi:WD40 repeat protein
MALQLGQLIYTNFDEVGFSTLSSAEIPLPIQKAFAARIVYQYWKAHRPRPGYQAVYLHQISPTEILFGWLYNDEADGLGQGYAPYFVCYYWAGVLKPAQLKALLSCLRIGPVALLDRHFLPESIDSVVITDPYRYRSARPGIAIPLEIQDQSARVLEQKEFLKVFVAIEPAAVDNRVRKPERRRFEQLEQPQSKHPSLEQSGLEMYPLRQSSRERRIKVAQSHDGAQSSAKAQGQLLLDKAQTEVTDSQIRQATLGKSFKLRVLGTLIILAVAVSSIYVLHLFSAMLGGDTAPESNLAKGVGQTKLTPSSAITPTSAIAAASRPLVLTQTLSGHTDAVWAVALSPDGRRLVSGGADHLIKIWDLQTGQVLSSLSGHTDAIRAIALSPDGQTLVSGSGDRTIKIWNLKTSKLTSTLEEVSPIWSVAFSPDGQTLVSGNGTGTLNFWQMSSGKLLYTIQGHTDLIFSVAVSPDGHTVATGSLDKTIKLWNLQTGKLLRTLPDPSVVRSVAFSPDGQTLASGSWDQTIKLWDWHKGTLLRQLVGHNDRIVTVAFADGQTLVSGSADRTIRRWNAQTGELLQTIDDSSNWILAIAVDSKEIVSGGKDMVIRVWK